jgi:uncharacterized protein YndB with AHSA1/START domain
METITVRATGPAPAERVWDLLATPATWPSWAPHMSHVSGADAREGAPVRIHEGQHLRIHSLLPAVVVPVTVTAVDEGTSWTMQARLPLGSIRSGHTVTTGPGGGDHDMTIVTVSLRWSGPRLIGLPLLQAYRPIAALSLRRLLRLAQQST